MILQFLLLWVLTMLGRRWTTRIIVTGEPLITKGPLRLIPHPNYAVVLAEIAVAPMVLRLTWVVLLFSILNAALLFGIRIPAENAALASSRPASR